MANESLSLSGLVGRVVGAQIPFLDLEKTSRVKVHAVEVSGIWLEHQTSTNQILKENQKFSAPRTIVFFVPFSQIRYVVDTIEVPSLLEEPV